MSDYTPDTGKVRTAYIHGVGGTTWYEGKADALLKQFDRWLAEVKAQAWEEGYISGTVDTHRNEVSKGNPYRQGQNTTGNGIDATRRRN